MTAFDLAKSLERAQSRLGDVSSSGRSRSDRGRSRLDAAVAEKLTALLQGHDRPPVREILQDLSDFCGERGLRVPARATIYQAMAHAPTRIYRIGELPEAAREALYNLPSDGEVPGHQLAFYCLNYGGLRASSFAAGLPWLALYQAARLRGWRPRSRGLLEAIRRVRHF